MGCGDFGRGHLMKNDIRDPIVSSGSGRVIGHAAGW